MTTPMKDTRTTPSAIDSEVAMNLAYVIVALIFAYVIQTIMLSGFLDMTSKPVIAAIGFAVFGIAKYFAVGKAMNLQAAYALVVAALVLLATQYLISDDVDTYWWAALGMVALACVDALVVIAAYWYKKFTTSKELVIFNVVACIALAAPFAYSLCA